MKRLLIDRDPTLKDLQGLGRGYLVSLNNLTGVETHAEQVLSLLQKFSCNDADQVGSVTHLKYTETENTGRVSLCSRAQSIHCDSILNILFLQLSCQKGINFVAIPQLPAAETP